MSMRRPKHILILHCDQLRADCLGYAGNPDVKTPHIDALAADGTVYTEHYTVYPICTPSRYSLWSGMYVHQHGAWNNCATLPGGYETFPRILKNNGYDTAVVGKMHFTPTYHDIGFNRMRLAEQNGVGRHEDDYHAELTGRGMIDRVDLHHQSGMFRDKPTTPDYDMFQCGESDLPEEWYSTAWITRGALDEIRAWDTDGRHLLMVGYIKPHHPFDPPYPYSRMYDPQAVALPPGYTETPPACDTATNGGAVDYRQMTQQQLRKAVAYYYATITQIDDGIGEIVALLKEKGLYDDTMIVFTSDHGEYLGYHHMLLKCNHLYDPLAKIPLVIKYAGQGPKGADSRLSENIDVSATVLRCAGLAAPDSMQGEDLLTGCQREFVFSEGQYGSDKKPCMGYMIRDKRYKLLVRGTLDDGMLFDLQRDPFELDNVFHDPAYADVLSKMKARLTEKMLFSGAGKNHCDLSAPRVKSAEETAERADRVKRFVQSRWEQTP